MWRDYGWKMRVQSWPVFLWWWTCPGWWRIWRWVQWWTPGLGAGTWNIQYPACEPAHITGYQWSVHPHVPVNDGAERRTLSPPPEHHRPYRILNTQWITNTKSVWIIVDSWMSHRKELTDLTETIWRNLIKKDDRKKFFQKKRTEANCKVWQTSENLKYHMLSNPYVYDRYLRFSDLKKDDQLF